eukprot:TRINITY_DN1076_c0_g1_i1.p1 TRINITY_DN1076_c0_g1~~TRINITY_DN1076_c0_g1_i1.p1  ORF type:complete len:173 (+),score=45.70 TRINITY_DN1076_c0_g1_i1:73-591(+)
MIARGVRTKLEEVQTQYLDESKLSDSQEKKVIAEVANMTQRINNRMQTAEENVFADEDLLLKKRVEDLQKEYEELEKRLDQKRKSVAQLLIPCQSFRDQIASELKPNENPKTPVVEEEAINSELVINYHQTIDECLETAREIRSKVPRITKTVGTLRELKDRPFYQPSILQV